jgi:serine/threonine protein phosphatase PrpC
MLTKMDCFGLTDVGRRRASNQDHYLIADLNKSLRVHSTSLNLEDETRLYGGSQGKLLLVADGMGGEAEGERASTIAVDQLATYVLNSLSWCYRLEESSENDFAEHLKEALQSCQDSIKTFANQRPGASGMGTTMTMVYIVWPRAFVVHVGDSRCYLLRNGRLEQITVDHTMANLLAETGQLSRDQARRSPYGHALWNAIGGKSDDLSVDVFKLSLERGDVLLLCTDGLYDMVSDERLTDVLSLKQSAETICRKLVDMANAQGGRDNITVIVAQFLSSQLVEQQDSEAMDMVDEPVASETTIDFESAGVSEAL